MLGRVDDEIEFRIKAECFAQPGQRRQGQVPIDDLETDSAGYACVVDLQDPYSIQGQEVLHGHHGMNVHDRTGLIDEQVESAVQDESGKGQFALCMDQDVEFSGLIRIR